MDLVLRQKIFSLFRDRYEIKDDQGKPIFVVEPKLALIPEYLIYSVAEDKLIYRIQRKIVLLLPKFEIYDANDQLLYIVKSKFALFNPHIEIYDQNEKEAFSLHGGILGLQYSIFSGDKQMASVSKKLISFSDTYRLHIDDEANAGLYLCLAMVFDNIHHNKKK